MQSLCADIEYCSIVDGDELYWSLISKEKQKWKCEIVCLFRRSCKKAKGANGTSNTEEWEHIGCFFEDDPYLVETMETLEKEGHETTESDFVKEDHVEVSSLLREDLCRWGSDLLEEAGFPGVCLTEVNCPLKFGDRCVCYISIKKLTTTSVSQEGDVVLIGKDKLTESIQDREKLLQVQNFLGIRPSEPQWTLTTFREKTDASLMDMNS